MHIPPPPPPPKMPPFVWHHVKGASGHVETYVAKVRGGVVLRYGDSMVFIPSARIEDFFPE